MENKKLPISKEFLAALLFIIGIFSNWAAVAMAIVILIRSSDEWLKKMMVRLLAVIFVFGVLSALRGVFQEIVDLIRLVYPVPYGVTTIVNDLISIADFLCMLIMSWNAYKGKVFTFGFLEKILANVYQKESGGIGATYCQNCGNPLKEEDRFCQKCGAKRL